MTIAIPSGYTKLAWHDEFDVDGAPSRSNWSFEKWLRPQRRAAVVPGRQRAGAGGLLVIDARREQKAEPELPGRQQRLEDATASTPSYTSSSMTTSGKQSWQYGRFEMRGTIPTAPACGPPGGRSA